MTDLTNETFGGTWPFAPRFFEHDGVPLPPPLIDVWKNVYLHAEVHRIETASHFLQEDEPEQIVSIVQDFLERNP
jgi:pimeloyl-ACP methyl ester carboxylesterase